MRKALFLITLASLGLGAYAAEPIVSTPAYAWQGDTIIQGPYTAYSVDGTQLISDYGAQPGYYMPVNKEWHLTNDITPYPALLTDNNLHKAIYNLALDEMINAVEPDTTLRTGKEWAGVWTRDVSYSILLSMAYMQPEASMCSLRRKVSSRGTIIQDTGSGGAWPVSSDRLIWAVAAFEVYKVTGDREWLEFIYPVIAKSVEDDAFVTQFTESGLVRGETSFIDWREQSHPRWMQTADIYMSETLSTSIVHSQAYAVLAQIATEMGEGEKATEYALKSQRIAEAVNKYLWLDEQGYYAMYRYGRNHLICNPRAETLGESLAILYGVATEERAKTITENNPTTPFGVGIFFPQISDMTPYHNNALWPWVAAYWALANAKAGNEQGTLEAIGSIYRPAALFTTNKENFVLDNGDIATELNSSNMLWCLAGNIAVTHKILFGIEFRTDGLSFKPFVPAALGGERTLKGFKYRNATLDITVKGHGSEIASFKVNGKAHKPLLPSDISGYNTIEIVMADNAIPELAVNHTDNVKSPLTPVVTLSNSPELNGEGVPVNNLLSWQSIEYIDKYLVLRDGVKIAETRQTTYPATVAGEYQVIGVSGNGVQSFASVPLDNYPTINIEFADEVTALASAEVSYAPREEIGGYHGGFVELDHNSGEVSVMFDNKTDGVYSLTAVYANGNGPVNTENKCAIRTIKVDGLAVGTIVMPHRGVANWSDWGNSNPVTLKLTQGTHKISISFEPCDENMNINTNHAIVDRLVIKQIDGI